jgi:uncharacterized membrane protein
MNLNDAVIKAIELHDNAGRELLIGRLHRAKAYILEAVRALKDVLKEREGFGEIVEELDELYQELYSVDPRTATAMELDRYRWRLHRLIEGIIEKGVIAGDAEHGLYIISVDGWVDPVIKRFVEAFYNAKKELVKAGYIDRSDSSLMAYAVGGKGFVRVGSAPTHITSVWYDPNRGGYVVRYYDLDTAVVKTLIEWLPEGTKVYAGEYTPDNEDAFFEEVVNRGYIDIVFRPEDAEKIARALALMASQDLRGAAMAEVAGYTDEWDYNRDLRGQELFNEAYGNLVKGFIEGRVSASELGKRWRAFVDIVNRAGARSYYNALAELKKIIASGGSQIGEWELYNVERAVYTFEDTLGRTEEGERIRHVVREARQRGYISAEEAKQILRDLRNLFKKYFGLIDEEYGRLSSVYSTYAGYELPFPRIKGYQKWWYQRRDRRRKQKILV